MRKRRYDRARTADQAVTAGCGSLPSCLKPVPAPKALWSTSSFRPTPTITAPCSAAWRWRTWTRSPSYGRASFVTASCDRIDFWAPARQGELVEASGRVIRVGRRSLSVEVTLTAEGLALRRAAAMHQGRLQHGRDGGERRGGSSTPAGRSDAGRSRRAADGRDRLPRPRQSLRHPVRRRSPGDDG